ncbi:MAG: hypothetical protein E7324_00195 [Clostridiales bacterium]|nr:hypothetical protein [Clostridiales bacterium]
MENGTRFTYERIRMMGGFDGKECKICPQIVKTEQGIFMTYTMLLLSGIDVVNDIFFVKSTDGGKTFGLPEMLEKIETKENGVRTIFMPGLEFYSKYHKKWFVFGRHTSYENDREPIMIGGIAIGEAGYTLRSPENGHYVEKVRPLPMPFDTVSATPFGQIVEYENGDFLLTFYATPAGKIKSRAVAVRYRYENGVITIAQAGEALAYPEAGRGLDEPSVAKLGNRYYMTLRTDEQGMISVSDNGLTYSAPIPWKWDDGSILENYNTMQRWIRHKDGLYLAYTRRGANNDHVFRHRAPLFMARFDEERMCLVKDSEVILVPELGARLGNFNVTELSENEFWLSTAEWMQPSGCEKYGSDNSLWIAKIRFE